MSWTAEPEFPEVQVVGLVRKREDHWSITRFLVNGQNEPKKRRDAAWLFQQELSVQSRDGKPMFHRRPSRRDLGKSDEVTFAEEQDMAMLYRHQVGFGAGHGVSVHADCPPGLLIERSGSLPESCLLMKSQPQHHQVWKICRRALELGLRTETPVYVIQNQKIVDLTKQDLSTRRKPIKPRRTRQYN